MELEDETLLVDESADVELPVVYTDDQFLDQVDADVEGECRSSSRGGSCS